MQNQGGTPNRRAEIGRARREKTRAKLISAAAEVIARTGQAKATIDDFIQAAGVARGTFYNYFPTRELLIDAVWGHVGREPFLEIHDACGKIDDPALRLVAEARQVINRAHDDEVWGWVIYALSGDLDEVNKDLLTFPLPMLCEGLERGRLHTEDIGAARDVVVNIVRGAILAKLMHRSSPAYERAICEMILLCLGIVQNEAEALAEQALELLGERFAHLEKVK